MLWLALYCISLFLLYHIYLHIFSHRYTIWMMEKVKKENRFKDCNNNVFDKMEQLTKRHHFLIFNIYNVMCFRSIQPAHFLLKCLDEMFWTVWWLILFYEMVQKCFYFICLLIVIITLIKIKFSLMIVQPLQLKLKSNQNLLYIEMACVKMWSLRILENCVKSYRII